MERFDATVQAGQFILDKPVRLPDGTRVTLDLVSPEAESFDDAERQWPTTQEGIEEMIRELEAIEPAVLTPQEEREIAAFRAACKAKDIEKMRRRMRPEP
jgi:hypothetical protein